MSITGHIELQKEFIGAHLKKPLVMTGPMGAGKTSIGKMVACKLDLPYIDSDNVIIERAGMSIPNIFTQFDEPHFRELEHNVIRDLMKEKTPHVIGTGGGAFINDKTREIIKKAGISIYLRASVDELVRRVDDDTNRPLLQIKGTPRASLAFLMEERDPIYAEADLTVDTYNEPEQETLNRVMKTLYTHLKPA